MKIELLYFDGCPNWLNTRADAEDVLSTLGVGATIDLVKVASNERANELRFVGSPSLRVDGVDVEPDAPADGFNLECRLYWVDGRPVGSPPREWIEAAVRAAD